MRKLHWFLLIVAAAIILFLVASKVVAGFDQAVDAQVVKPSANVLGGIVASITSHPIYVQYGFPLGLLGGIFISLIGALFLIPKVKSTRSGQRAIEYMHRPTATVPQTLKRTVASEPAEAEPEPVEVEATA